MAMIKIMKNELFHGIILILIFLLLLLTSCAGSGVRPESILLQQASSNTKAEKLNVQLAQKGAELKRPISSADYKIGPEDLLEINVFQAQELNTVVRVSASGYIKLSLIEPIKAAGLTVSELESLICKKLEKYLTEPVVGVFIKEYRSQQIAVLGSVKNPGVFYATGQRYLLDLLSMAGGLSPDAGDICIVQREGSGNGSKDKQDVEKIVIDLNALLIKGDIDLNIPLFSGDVIHVPQAGIFFVIGAVNGPGSFPLKGKLTFTQAISMAKGLTYEAVHSGIKIYRDNGKPEREVIPIDYDSVLDRKTPDFEIKDKDIIIVERSGLKGFLGRMATGLSFGIFRLGTYGTGF
jgi:polysaccharide export outer membrane protein